MNAPTEPSRRWYGKYPGIVAQNDDPLKLGRLRVRVPSIFGDEIQTGWAWPCAPYAGRADGGRGMLFVPEVDDLVWVEFAGGDLAQPIWSGCFWGLPESLVAQAASIESLPSDKDTSLPTLDETPAAQGQHVIRTSAGHTVAFDDDGGLVVIAAGAQGKAEIRMNADGTVVLNAKEIHLGSEGTSEKLVLGNKFMELFNQHTHPTGVGPSGPPTPTMSSSHLAKKSTTE